MTIFVTGFIYIIEMDKEEFRFAYPADRGHTKVCDALQYRTLTDRANSVFHQSPEAPPLIDTAYLCVSIALPQHPKDSREYMSPFTTAVYRVFDLFALPAIAPDAVLLRWYTVYDGCPVW